MERILDIFSQKKQNQANLKSLQYPVLGLLMEKKEVRLGPVLQKKLLVFLDYSCKR